MADNVENNSQEIFSIGFGEQSGYDSLETKEPGTLYIVTDTGRIYKGDVSIANLTNPDEFVLNPEDVGLEGQVLSLDNAGNTVWVDPTDPIIREDEMDIPKLFWTGILPTAKSEGNIEGTVKWRSKSQEFECYATLKVQGNSSTSYPKKNFTLALYEDPSYGTKETHSFRGWGNQSKYVMKANWIDLSHARNVVSCRIWSDVMDTRENYEDYPEQLKTSPNNGVVDGFPIKFYANGVYQGRYSFNIPKDAWMNNMDKTNNNEVILCGENYVGGCFRALPRIDETDWTDELHDTVPQAIKDSWTAAVDFVMNSTDASFYNNLSDYFDVNSLIDYYIFGIVSCNLDGFAKNQMYIKYANTPYIVQVYDLDSTWGLWWTGQSFVATDYTREEYQDFKDSPSHDGNLLFVRLATLFSEEIAERWRILRDGPLSIDDLIISFERWTDICPKELVEEDYAITTAEGAYTGIPSKTTNNIQQIRNYIVKRRIYADTKLIAAKFFDVVLSKRYAIADEQVQVLISTNLPSDAATITVSGHATFNAATGIITVNSDAQEGDIITINAVSDYDPTFTANATLTVSAIAVLYSVNKEFTNNTTEPEDTGLALFTSNYESWTMLIKAKAYQQFNSRLFAYTCAADNSEQFHMAHRANSNTLDVIVNNLTLFSPSPSLETTYGIRRDGNTLYYTTNGTTWNTMSGNVPSNSKTLIIGGHKDNGGAFVSPWDGNLICEVFDGQVMDLTDVWNTTYNYNERYITLNTSTETKTAGSYLQLSVASTNYRDQTWNWTVTGNATISATGQLHINDDASTGDEIVVTCTATNTVEQAIPATATCTVTVASSSSETIIWSNMLTDGTGFVTTLTNGVNGDINFANGDYIEYKYDKSQEQNTGEATLISFGEVVNAYNNAIHLNKQAGNTWVNFRSWLDSSAGSSSVDCRFNNPTNIMWVRIKADGIYYSFDGVTYTLTTYSSNQAVFDAWLADTITKPTVQIGSQQPTLPKPNGTFFEYVKIVKSSTPPPVSYYYELNIEDTEIAPSDSLDVSINTNLASANSTFAVTGNGSFNSTTMKLSANFDAQDGDNIVLTATSLIDSLYSDSVTVTVVVPPVPSSKIYVDKYGNTSSQPVQFDMSTGFGPVALPAIDWNAGDALEVKYRAYDQCPLIIGNSGSFPTPNNTYTDPKAHSLFDWPNRWDAAIYICNGVTYAKKFTARRQTEYLLLRIEKNLIKTSIDDGATWTTQYADTITFQDPTNLPDGKLYIGAKAGTYTEDHFAYIAVDKATV